MKELREITMSRIKPIRKRKICIRMIITAILIAAFSVPGLAAYVGWQLVHPKSQPIKLYPVDYGLSKTDIQFHSLFGNVLLKGWLIPSEHSKRIVIFAHGYGDNRSKVKPTLPLAKALHERGIAAMLFDFRNSGESDKDITSVGQFEKADLLSAIDYAKQLGYEQIGVIGFSMGGSTALITAPEVKDLKFVVADSPFADLTSYLRENLSKWSGLPDFPFTPLILWEIPQITGVNPSQVNPLAAIPKLKDLPVLLIHAEKDDKIASVNSIRLKEASNSDQTEVWITPGNSHVGTYSNNPQQYIQKVVDFVGNHFDP